MHYATLLTQRVERKLKGGYTVCLAVPAKVLAISEDGLSAEVEFGTVRRTISLQLLPDVVLGDYVLVHTGFAIATVDPEEARLTLELLAQMGDLDPIPEEELQRPLRPQQEKGGAG